MADLIINKAFNLLSIVPLVTMGETECVCIVRHNKHKPTHLESFEHQLWCVMKVKLQQELWLDVY